MKKIFLLLTFCSLTVAAMAQIEDAYPTLENRVVTNGFWDNWFVDAGATHLSSYSSQEHGLGLNKNPFWTGRSNWGGELSVGKWATPVFGMRVKGQAYWATQVNSTDASENPTYNQYSLSFQPMVNLTNLIGGYKARWWEVSLYGGIGFQHNITTNGMSNLLDVGVMNTWNISKRFHINLDVYGRMAERDMDGVSAGSGNRVTCRDLQIGFSAGVGVNLGKVGWDYAPDMDAILVNHKNQLAALKNSIAIMQAENEVLKGSLARKPKEKKVVEYVPELATSSASVFFNINKSVIASRKDLVNVKQLVDYAIANDKSIVVTGYADSATGSVAYNQSLSEKRAQSVAEEIEKMGLPKDKIQIAGQGGVADLEPISFNRRAIVTVK